MTKDGTQRRAFPTSLCYNQCMQLKTIRALRLIALAFVFALLGLTARAERVGVSAVPIEISDKIVAESADAYIAYDAATQTWEIGSAGIRRRMRYDPTNGYRVIALTNVRTGVDWLAPSAANTALRLVLGGQVITGGDRGFAPKGYQTWQHPDGSLELQVSLARGALTAHLHYVVFPWASVIEQWAAVENTGDTVLRDLTALDSISVSLRPSPEPLTLYWVQGLSPAIDDPAKPQPLPILRLRARALTDGAAQEIGSTARSSEGSMGWFALASSALGEGLFGGIEWSGAWRLSASRDDGQTALRAGIEDFRRDLQPGEIFSAPRRFLGFYQGDLDDAANASHAFARTYLMRPMPADFPWTQYNTWYAYGIDLDETQLRREVDTAAELGLELFYVDAGWYEGSPQQGDFGWGLGTWRENRDKFPSGLAAFSEYVHAKGMKFGLWVEPERVDLRYVGEGKEVPWAWLSPEVTPSVIASHSGSLLCPHGDESAVPVNSALEWASRTCPTLFHSPHDSSAGIQQRAQFLPPRMPADGHGVLAITRAENDRAETAHICLGHRDARAWMKIWLARLVRDNHLDWLKWDNNLWMSCDPPGRTGDGNYAHVQGLYEVLDFLRAEFPDLVIENCASGGNRMDYALMRRTDVAWLSDETEPSYRVRYHLAGASYPFPPEYLNAWLVDSASESLMETTDAATWRAWLRSRMMGAFGISADTREWSPALRAAVAREIAQYKQVRRIIANGALYRLLPQTDLTLPNLAAPAESDAAEFFSAADETGVVFLFQGTVPWQRRRLRLKGLEPETLYQITSADRTVFMRRTGQQLMTQGIRFQYQANHPSTLLFIQAAPIGTLPDSTSAP